MYSSLYDWSNEGYKGFSKFLQKLYKNSYEKDNGKSINRFLNNIENYFYELIRMGFINTNNFNSILKRLKTIKKVEELPKELCSCYALVRGSNVSINPYIKGNYGLSTESFQFMIDAHEIGHIIIHGWEDKAKEFCFSLRNISKLEEELNNIGLENKHIFYGFQLLDEVATQEMAERVTYQNICRKRPKYSKRYDKRIFNFKEYVTNYCIYGEFQSFAEKFARELKFLNCSDDDSLDVLLKLAKEIFNPDFINKIEYEMYNNPDKIYKLIMMLGIMGRVKEATYQLIEDKDKNKDKINVNDYVMMFNELSNRESRITYKKKK